MRWLCGWCLKRQRPLWHSLPATLHRAKAKEAGALPLAPDVTVIHPSLLTAVHPHPAAAVTLTEPLPPPTATAALVGSSNHEQPEA